MTTSSRSAAGPRHLIPLVIVGVALALRFVPGWVAPFTMFHFWTLGLGPLIGILGLLIWWVFAKGLPRLDRWLGLLYAIALLVLGFMLGDPSMPQFQVMYGLVVVLIAFGGVLYLTRAQPWPQRRKLLAVAVALAWIPWLFLRQDGQIGELTPEIAFRWAPTAEERFLETQADVSRQGRALESVVTEAEWSGFRGAARDGQVRGVSFGTDWQTRPPREVWRRRVGPGWSSFAVAGDLIYTQEQRGEDEVVVSYSLADGSEIWIQTEKARFEEPAAGAGPRATPTFDRGVIFALGATGSLQALDAATGERIWRRDLKEDVAAPVPYWGFSSSPLVTSGSVLVFAGGPESRAVVAYHRDTGELLWSAGDGVLSYSSAHFASVGGTEQILMASDRGLEALDPESGEILWEYANQLPGMARVVQPALLGDGTSIIVANGPGTPSTRLELTRSPSGAWSVREAWSSRFLKPYFNDLACHHGTCYGFDGKILTAIDADDGERRWKGGRYGHGQLILLPDMDVLLVISETGEVVLVEATPDEHREIARFQALAGKTWNHPVITRGNLLLRNAEEAACFELPA